MALPLSFYMSAGALLVGAFAGWTVRDWKCDASVLVAVQKGERREAKMADVINSNSTAFETFRSAQDTHTIEQRNTIREIYKNVEVPIDCAAPADARLLLAGLRERANASASGKFEEPVPSAPPTAQPVN